MTDSPETPPSLEALRERLLDAALMHVPFDGWSEATLRAARRDAGIDEGLARAAFPRGAVDLALAFHDRGDREMARRLKAMDLSSLRFRDRIATAVRVRLEAAEDREAVRRGTTLFALPQHAADGARALWSTADRIWEALGDSSDDLNWYTKRASLSGVYGATVLYWLGDESEGYHATWEFLDRRIADVMRIETAKARVNDNPVLRRVFAGPAWLASKVRPPARMPQVDLPGRWDMAPPAAPPGDPGR
jgi:ubiquinone biosynthesis protein COQ9